MKVSRGNSQEKQKKTFLTILLVVMFAIFAAFSYFYQQGRKLLENAHPWDYIALVVIFGLLFYYLRKYSKDKKQ